MANIDNLNFKVILDDKEFNDKIRSLKNEAKDFNTTMSNLLNVKKASVQISQEEVKNNRRALQAKVDEVKAQEKINREKIKTEGLQRKINVQIENASRSSQKMSSSISDVTNTFMKFASFAGIASLVKDMVRVTAEFELQRVSLGAMLNDMAAAEHIIGRIKKLAVESPFTFGDLTGYAKQLSAFAVPAEELFDTTKMLADLSAGLGVAADRLILAYGQVKSAAFLRGQEVRQFTEAGIPILQELAKEFEKVEGVAISVGEVFDRISTRQVSFEMVADVLKGLTSEGGKFYNMQQLQADTLWGKLRKLKDQWQIALNDMGKNNSSVINTFINGISTLLKHLETIGKILRTVIIAFGAYKAVLLVVWAAQKAMIGLRVASYFLRAARGVNSFAAAMRAANITTAGLIGAIAAVAGGMYALFTNSSKAAESSDNLTESLNNMHVKALRAQTLFSVEIESLKSLTSGTEAYREALERINTTYKEYLPQLLRESDTLEQIEEKTKKAKDAILEQARQNVMQKLEEERDRILDSSSYDSFMSYMHMAFGEKLPSFLKAFNDEILAEKDAMETFFTLFDRYGGSQSFLDAFVDNPYSTLKDDIKNAADYIRHFKKLNELHAKYVRDLFTEATWGSEDEYNEILAKEKEKEEKLLDLKYKNLSEEEHRIQALEIEKQHLSELIDIYDKYGNTTMADKHKRELQELKDFWKSWRGQVQDLLLGKGYSEQRSYGLWPTMYTSAKDYVEQIVKDYKEISEQVNTIGFEPQSLNTAKEQKAIIEAIADLLNIDLTTGKTKGNGKSELERKIDALSALKKAYDNLKKLNLSDTTIASMLKEHFPDIVSTYGEDFIDKLDFTSRILTFGKELKKTEPDRAHSILQGLGLTDLDNDKKVIEDALNAAKKYFDSIRKWKAADFNIEGEGAAFDVGKVANSLSNKFENIKLKADKLKESLSHIDLGSDEALEAVKNTFEKEFGEGTWDTFYAEFVKDGEKAIDKLAEMERDYERKLAQEKLNDLASRIVNEALEGVDMSHWGDKSINQIEEIRKRLSGLLASDIVLPEATVKLLTELGLKTGDLQKKIKELLGAKYDNATTEKFKALSKIVKEVSSLATTLGQDLSSLGETMGNEGLVRFGKTLVQFQKLASTISECDTLMKSLSDSADGSEMKFEDLAKSSDFITMTIKLTAMAISAVVNGIDESQQALHEARMAAIEYANALKQLEYNESKEVYSTIFGTDEYMQAREAMKDANKYMDDAIKKASQIKSKLTWKEQFFMDPNEAAYLSAWLDEGDILLDARSGWQKWWNTGKDLLTKVNISEFFDENGMLMGEKLRAFLNANEEYMEEENKELLTNMLNDYDLYVQAMEDATNYLNSIFNNVADSMAEAFVESFKASGEAALDYADIMDQVATNIAQSVVKSMVMEKLADPEKIKAMSQLLLTGDQAGAMEIFDEAMRSAAELAPYIQEFLEQMRPYFKMEEDSQSLGDGIKGITEDTANLLASYLNAIRADVSYSRTLWERMDANTQQIATILSGFSVPSFMEYQAQIAANTYNNAQYTMNIMLDLKSVMTSEGGATAIRTLS